MSYVSSSWPDGSPNDPSFQDPATGLVMWDMDGLGSDDHRWFHMVVDLDADLEPGVALLNQVEVEESPAADVDLDPSNNVGELLIRMPGSQIYIPAVFATD
jgi:hypothetical protein